MNTRKKYVNLAATRPVALDLVFELVGLSADNLVVLDREVW